jgi:hypothetical protein
MDAIIPINATGFSFATGAVVDFGFTRLYPGAFLHISGGRNTVTAADVAVMRSLVGLDAPAGDILERFNVNEVWGIDIHDFNSVAFSQRRNVYRPAETVTLSANVL